KKKKKLGNVEIIRYLITEHNVSICEDKFGWTPMALMDHVWFGQRAIEPGDIGAAQVQHKMQEIWKWQFLHDTLVKYQSAVVDFQLNALKRQGHDLKLNRIQHTLSNNSSFSSSSFSQLKLHANKHGPFSAHNHQPHQSHQSHQSHNNNNNNIISNTILSITIIAFTTVTISSPMSITTTNSKTEQSKKNKRTTMTKTTLKTLTTMKNNLVHTLVVMLQIMVLHN
ncbi:hypothetical protein RFI_16287, partial [Reticulomyxa filosa]